MNKLVLDPDAKFHNQATDIRRLQSRVFNNGSDLGKRPNVTTNFSSFMDTWKRNRSNLQDDDYDDDVDESTVVVHWQTKPNTTTLKSVYTTAELTTGKSVKPSTIATVTTTSTKAPSKLVTTQWFTSNNNDTNANTGFTNATTGFTVSTISSTEEAILGTVWDGWRRVFDKSYWQKRLNDRHYLMELFLPTMAGIVLGVAVLICVLFLRWIRHLKCRRRGKRNRLERYDKNAASDKWMLLERESSDESEEI